MVEPQLSQDRAITYFCSMLSGRKSPTTGEILIYKNYKKCGGAPVFGLCVMLVSCQANFVIATVSEHN